MVTVQKTDTALLHDCVIICINQDQDLMSQIPTSIRDLYPMMSELTKQLDFKGSAGSILAIPITNKQRIIWLIMSGMGKKMGVAYQDFERYRRAVGSAIKTMQQRKINAATIYLPSAQSYEITDAYLAEQTTVIANMAAYRFDEFITDQDRKVNQKLIIALYAQQAVQQEIQNGIDRGTIIAKSVNHARHWVDSPAIHITPLSLADKAAEIAQTYGLKATIFNEKQVNQMGMGGLSAVSAGSDVDCRFVILEYHTKTKNAPTLAFVGKGITFDSGGLSLKPAAAMETMKEDMSGAAAVIGAMQVLAQIKPNVNIVAITPLSENLPSGKATKPGDIIKFYNGKTAEVKNTDAEGRLILADALSYAVKHYKPDVIIDLATLTGACAYALGPFFAGLMSQHDNVVHTIEEAAHRTGERVWRLPLDNDYKIAVKSDVADLCNIGSAKYRAGAITAACFLQNFVDDVPWAHLDIAGTAFDVPDISYYSTGATGYGVRLLIDIALHWK